MKEILRKLEGGNRRSIGQVDEVIADVLSEPSLFDALFDGMLSDDPMVSMRAADATEKITGQHPEYLRPYKTRLIEEVAQSEQKEVRWHVAQLIPRLDLSAEERDVAVEILLGYLDDESRIVKTFSMQALADLAERDPGLQSQIIPLLKKLTETGSPAMKSRGRRLLHRLSTSSKRSEG